MRNGLLVLLVILLIGLLFWPAEQPCSHPVRSGSVRLCPNPLYHEGIETVPQLPLSDYPVLLLWSETGWLQAIRDRDGQLLWEGQYE